MNAECRSRRKIDGFGGMEDASYRDSYVHYLSNLYSLMLAITSQILLDTFLGRLHMLHNFQVNRFTKSASFSEFFPNKVYYENILCQNVRNAMPRVVPVTMYIDTVHEHCDFKIVKSY